MATPVFRSYNRKQLALLPPTQVLGETHFVAQGLNVIFGASGSFKSFYQLGYALQLSRTMPVLFIAAEGSGGLDHRISAWETHYQQEVGQIEFICQEVNLLDLSQTKSFISQYKLFKPALTIFDTLARCIPGGDENSARDMGLAVKHAGLIQRELKTAINWIHHTNRADRGERGSGALRGASDCMIEIAASGDGIIRASCSKSKDTEPWEPEDLIFKQVGDSGVLVPASEMQGIAINLTSLEKSIMEFIALSVFETAGAQTDQIVRALNISERHVYRLLSGLKNKGIVRHVRKSLPVALTDMGFSILQTFADKNLPISHPVENAEVDLTN